MISHECRKFVPEKIPVPENGPRDIDFSSGVAAGYAEGWNECVDAMKAAPQGEPVGWSITHNGEHTGNFFHNRESAEVQLIDLVKPAKITTVTSNEEASAYLESSLWQFIDMAASWPHAKPNQRTWEHVLVYAPQPVAAEPPIAQPAHEQRRDLPFSTVKMQERHDAFVNRAVQRFETIKQAQPAKSCATCKHHDNASYQLCSPCMHMRVDNWEPK